MDSDVRIRDLLVESKPLVLVTLLLTVPYYVGYWIRTDLGSHGGVFEFIGTFVMTVVGVAGLAVFLVYVVARGVALGREESG